jgi:hypothetical protein
MPTDPVVRPGNSPIVLQLEMDGVGESGALSTLLGDLELLDGERHAVDEAAGGAGEIEAEAAPSRADVEHALAFGECKLGGEMPLLGLLCRLQRCPTVRKIGARVLSVGIEEQVVDRAVDVVVMGDVTTGAPRRIELRQSACQKARDVQGLCPAGRGMCHRILEHQRQQVVDPALLHNEPAIHIGFADMEMGIERELIFKATVAKSCDH